MAKKQSNSKKPTAKDQALADIFIGAEQQRYKLRQGESINPGKGLAVVRYANVTDAGIRKPSGGGGGRSSVPIYGQVGGAAGAGGAAAGAGGGGQYDYGSGLRAPNDGSFGNITTNLSAQAKQGQEEAKRWAQMQAQLDNTNAQVAADMQAQADQQAASLQSLAIQQQQAYEAQIKLQQEQIARAEAAAAEQKRQADALARANVPDLQPTAQAPTIGDARPLANTAGRTNTLSSLSILTGFGGSGSTLAGLQIA